MSGKLTVSFAVPEPALLIREQSRRRKTLCVSDLHLGYERELAEKGYTVPSQTEKIVARLLALIERHDVKRLCILGDVKHAVARFQMSEWAEIPIFFEKILNAVSRVEVFPGNHDGGIRHLAPRSVVFQRMAGSTIGAGRVAVQHGHAWPTSNMLNCDYFVVGHHHPVAVLKNHMHNEVRIPVWLVGPWERNTIENRMMNRLSRIGKGVSELQVSSAKVIVLPAFNNLVPGKVVNSLDWKPASPILKGGGIRADSIQVFTLDGTLINNLSNLIAGSEQPIEKGGQMEKSSVFIR